MSEYDEKEVWFSYYCPTCKHRNVEETKDPCNECLTESANINSHMPAKYAKDGKTNYDPSPRCIKKLNHINGDYQKILPNGKFSG